MPFAATALLIAAAPVVVLMVVWTVVTVGRILWPESEPLPIEVLLERHERARLRGEAVPVSARDIVDDLRRRRAHPVSTQSPVPADEIGPDAPDPRARLAADLWVRRN